MVWPGVSDYQEAVQAPQLCFSDPELKQGSPVLTKLGLPRPISGGNASVYQIRSGRREFAVRCFLRNVPELRQRYAAIDAHLRSSSLGAKVGFDYLQDGIRIRGQWFPILKMEWVRGLPLNDHIAGIRGDAAALRRLAADWLALIRELERERIAHGDLQHGNVMVAKDKFVLIDYDGMFVPALAGSPGLELGHPSFQHPQRQGADFGPTVDRFAALTIYAAILAVAEKPELWATYDNADNLLFTRTDFEDHRASPVFAELLQLRDPAALAAVQALQAACSLPVADVPKLDDVVAAGAGASPSRSRKAQQAATPAPKQAKPAKAAKAPKSAQSARPATAPASAVSVAPAAGGGKPQWLASLMAGPALAMPAPIGASSLTEVWKHRGPGAVTRAAAAALQRRPAVQRTVVIVLLFALVQCATWAVYPPALFATFSVFAAHLWWSSSRRRRRQSSGSSLVVPAALTAASGGRVAVALAFSRDGSQLATVGGDGIAEVIAWSTGKRDHRLLSSSPTLVGVVAVAKNRFATIADDGVVQLHDAAGAVTRAWRQARACCACASADGEMLAVGTTDHMVKTATATGQDRCTLRGHRDRVAAVAIAHDGRLLVSGSADHTVRLWSVQYGKCEHVLRDHRTAVQSVAISADGSLVAAGAADGRVLVWDGKRSTLLHTVNTGTSGVGALAFVPDAAMLLAGCADGAIRCIDAGAGKVLSRQPAHTAPVAALAVSADGRAVASADQGGTVSAWTRPVRAAAGVAAGSSAPAALQLAQP